ncbi:sorbosone dehydrogenase family protein [uncultured Cytophaga sp.]|uniref:PQQ-dependent sugar dehydrogenase n=1 Tax=uncultured Cytophaga sp. TaxID=160238 RepID=UPI002629F986|nr:sorbosone dehydrogenase family protein [uncultured Cytophaga sp.]
MERFILVIILMSIYCSCSSPVTVSEKSNNGTVSIVDSSSILAQPYATESAKKFSKAIGWADGNMPVAPEGFVVQKFSDKLENPRWIYVLPNGDVLIAEAGTKGALKAAAAFVSGNSKSRMSSGSADRITLFRDANKDGIFEMREVFLKDLNQPLGMVLVGEIFYVANTDGVVAFPYKQGQTNITATGKKITDLPANGYNNHWTRNLITNKSKDKLFITVGSSSNVAEHGIDDEVMRANILVMNLDGSNKKVFASGLRNPVGMEFNAESNVLWTAVNERDELGDELVPDYLTSVTAGGFYGWPYSYWGQHVDPRMNGERMDLVKTAIVPEVSLGSHTASLGLAFYTGNTFPENYHGGAFIGQHGSWNKSTFAGYKVVFVPFKNGKPSGEPQDFLTGFVANENEVYGRPVGIAVLPDGSILVADDSANTIWRVSKK